MELISSPPSAAFGATHDLVSGASNDPTHGISLKTEQRISAHFKTIKQKRDLLSLPASSSYRFTEIYQYGCVSGEAPASGATAPGVTYVSGDAVSGGTPISGVAASGVTPVSGEVDTN